MCGWLTLTVNLVVDKQNIVASIEFLGKFIRETCDITKLDSYAFLLLITGTTAFIRIVESIKHSE